MLSRIAFLDILATDDESFRAAALVTDPLGRPVEFRITTSVKPTQLQKTLWGDRLGGHLNVSVLASPLVAALTVPPDLILIRHHDLLDLRPLVGCPVLLVGVGPEEPGARPLISSRTDERVHVLAHAVFPTDLDAAIEDLNRLDDASLLEPFTRITRTVALIAQEETQAIGV